MPCLTLETYLPSSLFQVSDYIRSSSYFQWSSQYFEELKPALALSLEIEEKFEIGHSKASLFNFAEPICFQESHLVNSEK